MGKLKLKKSQLSEINLLLEGDQKSKMNWENLEQINENAFRLKPSEEYDNEHLILGFIEDLDYLFIRIKIPQFINEIDSVKSGIEKVKYLETLIKKKVGVSIMESLLYSFSVVAYTTEVAPIEFLESVWHITRFELKNRSEKKVIFENKKDGLLYDISYNKGQINTNSIKHELIINDPSKFFGVECSYKALELEQVHLLCESYLNIVLSSTIEISEIEI